MKNKLKSIDYMTVVKYLSIFLLFLLLNNVEKQVLPYSTAMLCSVLSRGGSLILTPILYLLSFIVQGQFGLLASAAIAASVNLFIIGLYRKFKNAPKYEVLVFLGVSLLGFIFIGNTTTQIDMDKRVLTLILTVALGFFTMTATKVVAEKGLKFKLGFEEFASLSLVTAITGLGVCNLISPLIWKGISVLILLLACYLYRTGIATIVSSVLGLSLAIYYHDLNMVALYLILAIAAESMFPISRYSSAIAVVGADYVVQMLFGVYSVYSIVELIAVLSGAAIFCAIPNKPLKSLKEKLYSFREKQLVRQSINRNRIMLAGRLYDLSGVFTEMATAFNSFNRSQQSEEKSKEVMKKEILSACKDCDYYDRCKEHTKTINLGVSKMLDIGFAKGRLSLIDLPKEIGDICIKPQNTLYAVNKLLADYRTYAIERANVQSGRNLLAAEALGVAEILRGLALESGATLKFQSRLERSISTAFFKSGILVSELLIFGEEDRISVSMVVVMEEFSIPQIEKILSKCLDVQMSLCERAEISDCKCYLSFRKAVEYDAVFGLSSAVKDGSTASGDTHTATRISGDKFLVALSDGMGSGKDAEEISSASLSLIESFYKAGLNSPLILNTVNKLLSINTEDNFAALDVSVIDLNDLSADFIKYGSPYGFIIGENGVKIIEGSSLPLGIIEELKPSVCHTDLSDGDMLLFMTDGISDAFGSSGEVIDYLRSVPALNPQTLADGILSHALKLSNGKKNDDMTALAVRIYRKNVG